tara:strand:+ start:390 stop:992 length:603 start_codon:yes stop_codon:yes gene_type:complete
MKLTKTKLKQIIMEEITKVLAEATDLLQTQNNKVVIFADWAKGHIEGGHKKPGKGSIFADFDLSLIGDALKKINIEGKGGVASALVPGVGYDLVLPMDQALALPDAEKVQVSKEERGKEVIVTGIRTSAPLAKFSTDKLSVVIRPTTDLQYVPDDVKERVAAAVKAGQAYSILSAWPGRGDVPPSSQWGDDWAVIIPKDK